MSNTNITTTTETTTVVVEENIVRIELNNIGVQGVPGANTDPTYVTVRNATGATLPKGTIVYISGANGNHVQVTPAIATSDATSARTLGWLSAAIANNASGLCMVEGYLEGINTQSFNAGDQLYLSGTVAGGFTATEPQAPIHLVYVGVVTKKSAGDGHVFVKVQNGYELEELHNVQIINPTNNQVLAYDSATQLWKNATNAPDGVTSITAVSPLTGGTITSTGSIGLDQTALSITKSQVSDFTSGTVTSASTAQQAGIAVFATNASTAVFATTSGTATFATNASTAVTISGTITKSQVSDFTSGTVAQADNATTSGTALFANTSGTATYSTTSGTALTISGDITKSQVSDFTSGTVASAGTAQQAGTAVFATNASTAVSVSGSAITQSQVVNLVSDLAGKANLAGGNAFTGNQDVTGALYVAGSTATRIQGEFVGASGQSVPYLAVKNSGNTIVFQVASSNSMAVPFGAASVGTSSILAQLGVVNSTASQVGAVIRGAASQSANLQEWQDSSANILARISQLGSIVFPVSGSFISGQTGGASIVTALPATVPMVVRGAASQTADLLQIQNSGSTAIAKVTSAGVIETTQYLNMSTSANAGIAVGGLYRLRMTTGNTVSVGSNASIVNFIVQGVASQTANLQEWQTSDGSVRAFVSAFGLFATGSPAAILLNSGGGNSRVSISTVSTLDSGLTIRAVASQTADVLQIQNSAGVAKLQIQAGGNLVNDSNIKTPALLDTGTSTAINFGSSRNVGLFAASGSFGGGGGVLSIANAGTVPTSNPSGGGILYVEAGALKFSDSVL